MVSYTSLFFLLRQYLLLFTSLSCLSIRSSQAYTTLSNETLKSLHVEASDFDIHSGPLLAPILRPRVPGTPSHDAVLLHLVDFFRDQLPKWTIEMQNSTSTTPATGANLIPFTNLILTRDPPWTSPGEVGRLALAAHYDSKLTPHGFIGATDSAAPCAMLMHMAKSVDEALTRKWDAMAAEGVDEFDGLEEHKGVQILLLDGEEAFVSWTRDDSLYGARALAEEWEQTYHPALSTYTTPLNSISIFLLLDLLGASAPRVPSYFPTTHWAYTALSTLEARFRDLSLFSSHTANPKPWLHDTVKESKDFRWGWGVQDDHVPFMARGVEILHMIPTPFPRVWHEMDDDAEHLDMPTVLDWAKLITAFVGEWMDLDGFLEQSQPQAKAKAKREDGILRSRTEL